MAVADAGSTAGGGGGQQELVGPAAAHEPTTGQQVFPVSVALLASHGLGPETGVVEAPAVPAAAPGRPGGR